MYLITFVNTFLYYFSKYRPYSFNGWSGLSPPPLNYRSDIICLAD